MRDIVPGSPDLVIVIADVVIAVSGAGGAAILPVTAPAVPQLQDGVTIYL